MKRGFFIISVDRACLSSVVKSVIVLTQGFVDLFRSYSSPFSLLGVLGLPTLGQFEAAQMKELPLHCLWAAGALEECSGNMLGVGVL